MSALSGLLVRRGSLLGRLLEWHAERAACRAQDQLETIRTYAEFVRSNPNMPDYHRQRCLDSAIRECAELGRTLDSALGGRPLRQPS